MLHSDHVQTKWSNEHYSDQHWFTEIILKRFDFIQIPNQNGPNKDHCSKKHWSEQGSQFCWSKQGSQFCWSDQRSLLRPTLVRTNITIQTDVIPKKTC